MRSKCNILFVFIFLLCNCTDEKSDDINPSKDLATTLSAGINKAISSYTYNSQTYHLEFENNSLSNVFTTNSDLRINMTKLPLSFTIMYYGNWSVETCSLTEIKTNNHGFISSARLLYTLDNDTNDFIIDITYNSNNELISYKAIGKGKNSSSIKSSTLKWENGNIINSICHYECSIDEDYNTIIIRDMDTFDFKYDLGFTNNGVGTAMQTNAIVFDYNFWFLYYGGLLGRCSKQIPSVIYQKSKTLEKDNYETYYEDSHDEYWSVITNYDNNNLIKSITEWNIDSSFYDDFLYISFGYDNTKAESEASEKNQDIPKIHNKISSNILRNKSVFLNKK